MDTDINYQSNYLFVYGTLLDDENEFGIYLKNNSQFFAKGKFRGLLYDVGEYPGAIYRPEGDTYVFGTVLDLNDTGKILELLDAYEGFGNDEEQPNLFVRELLEVETAEGVIDCWVYLYNLPVSDLPVIPEGWYFNQ